MRYDEPEEVLVAKVVKRRKKRSKSFKVAWCLAIALALSISASGVCIYRLVEKNRLLTLDYINANNKYETQRATRLALSDEFHNLQAEYDELYEAYSAFDEVKKSLNHELYTTNLYLKCCSFSRTEAKMWMNVYKSAHEYGNREHDLDYNFDNVYLRDSIDDVMCVCGVPDDVVVDYTYSNTGYNIENSVEVYILYYGSSAVLLNDSFQVAGCIHGDTRIPYLDWERP